MENWKITENPEGEFRLFRRCRGVFFMRWVKIRNPSEMDYWAESDYTFVSKHQAIQRMQAIKLAEIEQERADVKAKAFVPKTWIYD